MKIAFHGADRGVTGSCHLLDCAGKRILIDCGLYQGGRELDEENADELARRIVDGARQVRIFGEEIPVRAKIHTINGFSAHADQTELLAWHKHIGTPARTFLVHGEKDIMARFATKLKNTQVEMPKLGQTFTL